MTPPSDLPETAESMRVDVLRGAPTSSELAALMAVVTEAYQDESAGATADESSGRDAWSLSQRSLRAPLRRDLGWGRFGG
ncbi:acyl-CoA carboxylase subunit epsilon [Microbacterium sp.]|uniref:acyl-CoA carboxylase subunit epsilon n=1 Tax=Microbacterium sp. TaxID=51671 RepID=UPI002E34DF22|nr:acyl-CoA carboxylase subunit epsilon [Microbacterium sp.]HEX5730535.1 acyl-CoA carboxylase subunit epsilon [Microbacterium sp.]